MSLVLRITNAGRAALVNAARDGTNAVRIVSVGVSPTANGPDPAFTILPGERKRIATISGGATAADVIHLTVRDESADSYTVRSFALYLADGTMFAIYGQADPIIEKSTAALLLLAIDATLVDVAASQVTFGNANFLNPAATTETPGVVELATEAEAAGLIDAMRALTPKGLATVFTAANILNRLLQVDGAGSGVDADLLDGLHASDFIRRNQGARPIDYDSNGGGLSIAGDVYGWATGMFLKGPSGGVLGGFGGFGGADKLEWLFVGPSYNARNALKVYPDRVTWNDAVVWNAGNDGAGSGLDADLLDGLDSSYFTNIIARLGYTPVQQGGGPGQAGNALRIGWSGARLKVAVDNSDLGQVVFDSHITDIWRSSNDGAGSGLDADLLDGQQGSWYADITARLGYTPLDATAYTAADVRAKLLTVDGAGSGVDADLLDGLHASTFMRRDTGSRPIDYDAEGGALTMRGDQNGWAIGTFFKGAAGADLGGFGAFGGGNALNYYYIGPVYNAPHALKIYPDRVTWNDAVVWNASNDGAGSGLDADLLDGLDSGYFTNVIARLGYIPVQQGGGPGQAGNAVRIGWSGARLKVAVDNSDLGQVVFDSHITDVWRSSNDGAGSGLDADLLDGQQGSWYADITARLGYTPLNTTAYTAADVRAKLLTVDGAGSGVDADLLDGLHASDFIRRNSGSRPIDYDAEGGALTMRGDQNGWAIGTFFKGAAGADLGGFGILGGGNSLSYYYIGPVYNARNALKVYPDRVTWNDAVVWNASNDGAGSGLDADLLDGLDSNYFTNVIARLGYIPVQQGGGPGQAGNAVRIGWSGARLKVAVDNSDLGQVVFDSHITDVWRSSNDGAGSGLDADLLDGWQRDDIRRWGNLLDVPGTFTPSAHSHGAADLAPAFATRSFGPDGYQVLPGGLILQWVTGATDQAGGELTQTITYPIAFPNRVLRAFPSTQIVNSSNRADALYQLVGEPGAASAVVQRQRVDTSNDFTNTTPHLFVIGY